MATGSSSSRRKRKASSSPERVLAITATTKTTTSSTVGVLVVAAAAAGEGTGGEDGELVRDAAAVPSTRKTSTTSTTLTAKKQKVSSSSSSAGTSTTSTTRGNGPTHQQHQQQQQQRSILAYGRISKAKALLERKVQLKSGKEVGGGGEAAEEDRKGLSGLEGTITGTVLQGPVQQVEGCLQGGDVGVLDKAKSREEDQTSTSSAAAAAPPPPPQTPRKRIRTVTPRTPSSATASRGKSLIDRIREKELRRSALPPPPSKTELERKSALDRLPEIVSILTCLCVSSQQNGVAAADESDGTSMVKANKMLSTMELFRAERQERQQRQQQQKISFPLPVLIQHLQNSMRNPMSREEGEQSIRLLAEEVAPDWVGLMTMGKGKLMAAVLNRAGQPGTLELRRRLDGILRERGD
ncbi:MAG: hypothetical protein M1816_006358 [Peltula sp. TS41687]|nr:MAG: hypothetical protein M1816_006358 [Peltula sp. TS41687]